MSLAQLTQAFVRAASLNQQVLQALTQGRALADLAPLFDEKAALGRDLERWLPELERQRHLDGQGELGAALQAQAEAARSEAKVSEALSKIVSLGGIAKDAYQQKNHKNGVNSWEVRG